MSGTKRYLLVLWDGGGVVPPLLGVARRLIARGHAVRVLGDPTVEDEARAAGCEFASWARAPHRRSRDRSADILDDYNATSKMRYLEEKVGGYFYAPGSAWTADILDAVDAHPVDVVLTDSMLPWGALAAEKRRIPCAVLNTMPYAVPTPNRPPAGAAMVRVPGFLAPARDALFRWMYEWIFDKFVTHVNRVRVEHGLAPVAHTLDQVRRADATLVLTAAAFDSGGLGAPAHVHWVGAQLDDPSWCDPWTSPWPPEDTRPLVLVGLSSTFQAQVPLLKNLVAALTTLPVRALVTLGPTLHADEVPGTDNVRVVPSVPHSRVLPHAALLVTHCGHGTTLKGLAAGVPMVCVPMGRDQDDNAARVANLGAGLTLGPKASVGELRAAIERVLGTPAYGVAARGVAATIARREGERDAVEVLEALTLRAAGDDAGFEVRAVS